MPAKVKRTRNPWVNIAVHYTDSTGKEVIHHLTLFVRRDFDLASVKRHCLGNVLQWYKLANIKVSKFTVTESINGGEKPLCILEVN
jgi:hypothetical protein